MKNKYIATLIVFIMTVTFLLTGCSTKKSNENELVFWTLQMGTFDKYITGIIDEFEAQNPDIKIKWVDVPYSEGEKRTLAALLSDNPPDLINLTPDFSAMAAQKNTLFEIPKSAIDENFPTSLQQSLSFNGKFFAVPFYVTSAITFANKDLMAKSNIKSVPKTYDEMFAQAKNAKSAGFYIEMPTVNENMTFLKILNKYNVNVYENINSDQAYRIFSLYKNLYQNNLIPKESLTQNHREALEKYMSGQIVFLQAGSNFLNIIKENAPTVYDSTVLSEQMTGDSGKYDYSLMNLIIPKKSKHAQDALKFALFLTNKENQLELAKLTSVLPANKFALSDEYFNKTDSKEALARNISANQIKNLGSEIQNRRSKKNLIMLTNTALAQIMTNQGDTTTILFELNKKIQDLEE